MSLSPSSALFYWSARYGPIPVVGGSPVHTRNGSAVIDDQRGQMYSAIVNTPRFGWDTINGERRQTMLLEAASTNNVFQSEVFTSWTLNAATLTQNQPDPFGNTNATTISTTSAGGAAFIITSFTGNGTKSISAFVKQGTATSSYFGLDDNTAAVWRLRVLITWTAGVPTLSIHDGAGTLHPPEDLGNGWWHIRCSPSGVVAANSNIIYIYPAASSSGTMLASGVQGEDSLVSTSYIKTTAGAVSRAADDFAFGQSAPTPQAMAIYMRFVEDGSATLTASTRLFNMGNSAGGAPVLAIYAGTSSFYTAYHHNGTTAVSAPTSAAPNIGDVVEIVMLLSSAGAVRIIQSINGATVTDSGYSGNNTLAGAWSDVLIFLNSAGTGTIGFNRFAEMKVVKFADLVSTTAAGYMSELQQFELGPNGGQL